MDYEKAKKKIGDYFNSVTPEEFIKICEKQGMKFVPIEADGYCRNGVQCTSDSHKKCFVPYSENEEKLPSFLYRDNGEIKVGVHGDTVVTDEWNEWIKQSK